MLFNSYLFIVFFLPLSLFGYFGAAHWLGQRAALLTMTLYSLLFYAWWNPPYTALILLSMAANKTLGRYLSRNYKATPELSTQVAATLGVALNLALLGYYKYANFFISSLQTALGTPLLTLQTIVLPLGISFFTFEQIGYVVDAYHGKARNYSVLEYMFFVTFYPHLIAGPIIAHHQLLSQVSDPKRYSPRAHDLAVGATLFGLGLFKKVVLADHLSHWASPVFAQAEQGTALLPAAAWLGSLSYALQLYFDFSGYSDMGIGLARLFNFKLPLNFNAPYKAINIIDFWRRWHMTLSSFLRDYLYIALGGNRHGLLRRHTNLFLTMLLGGLWHGAGWGFVLWGGLHGAYLIVNHTWQQVFGKPSFPKQPNWRDFLRRELGVQLTFLAVLVGWVFFRATNVTAASRMLSAMAHLGSLHVGAAAQAQASAPWSAWAWCGVAYALARWAPTSQELLATAEPALEPVRPLSGWRQRLEWSWTPQWAGAMALIALAGCLSLTEVTEFLYFQF